MAEYETEPLDVNAVLGEQERAERRGRGRPRKKPEQPRTPEDRKVEPGALKPLTPADWEKANLKPPAELGGWYEAHGPRTTALTWDGELRDGVTPRLRRGEKKGPFVRRLDPKEQVEYGELFDEGPGVFRVRLPGFHEVVIPDDEGERSAVDRFMRIMNIRAVDMDCMFEVESVGGDGGGVG